MGHRTHSHTHANYDPLAISAVANQKDESDIEIRGWCVKQRFREGPNRTFRSCKISLLDYLIRNFSHLKLLRPRLSLVRSSSDMTAVEFACHQTRLSRTNGLLTESDMATIAGDWGWNRPAVRGEGCDMRRANPNLLVRWKAKTTKYFSKSFLIAYPIVSLLRNKCPVAMRYECQVQVPDIVLAITTLCLF